MTSSWLCNVIDPLLQVIVNDCKNNGQHRASTIAKCMISVDPNVSGVVYNPGGTSRDENVQDSHWLVIMRKTSLHIVVVVVECVWLPRSWWWWCLWQRSCVCKWFVGVLGKVELLGGSCVVVVVRLKLGSSTSKESLCVVWKGIGVCTENWRKTGSVGFWLARVIFDSREIASADYNSSSRISHFFVSLFEFISMTQTVRELFLVQSVLSVWDFILSMWISARGSGISRVLVSFSKPPVFH